MDFNLNGILIFNLNETTPSPYSKEIKNRDNVKFKTVNTLQASGIEYLYWKIILFSSCEIIETRIKIEIDNCNDS